MLAADYKLSRLRILLSRQFLYFSDIRTTDLLPFLENTAIDLVTNS